MTTIGTPLAPRATRVMLLGSGELGKEVAIELMRLGCEVIAVDRYANAPAMQVAHRSHVINMLDGAALRGLVEQERPQLIVPEIEAIATAELVELEARLQTVRLELAGARETAAGVEAAVEHGVASLSRRQGLVARVVIPRIHGEMLDNLHAHPQFRSRVGAAWPLGGLV